MVYCDCAVARAAVYSILSRVRAHCPLVVFGIGSPYDIGIDIGRPYDELLIWCMLLGLLPLLKVIIQSP